jgi:hypothetical protein
MKNFKREMENLLSSSNELEASLGQSGMPVLRSSNTSHLLPEEFADTCKGVERVAISAALLVWF